ncbi:putative inorganic carbon transporter subunit DabA, partial [Metallibacterium scheffleri]|uniref:putative inorganic carbon transporter subunit DabA n=1 Tax=Metallibacterium scheffleri TaxID=993689 RepID=UPI0023F1FF14
GQLGVLEGNAGDLKVGLPWQSVHDGTRFVHEPLRLNVFIEAPEAEINGIIGKHEGVRNIVDNGWIHLFSLADEGRTIRRYVGGLQWRAV